MHFARPPIPAGRIGSVWDSEAKAKRFTFTVTNLCFEWFGASRSSIAVGDVIRQYSHREELFVWQAFWRDAADGFTVVSKEVFRFDTPIPVMTCIAAPSSETYPLQRRRNALSPFLPYGISLKELWDVTGELCTGKTVLSKGPARLAQQRWGFQGQDAIALPLIEPLATLLLKGFWFSFCFRKSWALPRPLFPGIENGGVAT